jgi:hypothetical protein
MVMAVFKSMTVTDSDRAMTGKAVVSTVASSSSMNVTLATIKAITVLCNRAFNTDTFSIATVHADIMIQHMSAKQVTVHGPGNCWPSRKIACHSERSEGSTLFLERARFFASLSSDVPACERLRQAATLSESVGYGLQHHSQRRYETAVRFPAKHGIISIFFREIPAREEAISWHG